MDQDQDPISSGSHIAASNENRVFSVLSPKEKIRNFIKPGDYSKIRSLLTTLQMCSIISNVVTVNNPGYEPQSDPGLFE